MSKTTFLLALLLALLLAGSTAGAYTLEQFQFDSEQQEKEFRVLLEELRCVVCQNETLAGSQADVAQIMREEVYRLVKSGKSPVEVKAHLVTRYGDFVLYKPPFKPSTYPLWIGPFILFAIGGFFLVRALTRKKESRESELSAEEQERLKALLDEKSGKKSDEKPAEKPDTKEVK